MTTSFKSVARVASLALVAVAASFPAHAEPAWYGRGDVGVSFSTNAKGDIFTGNGFGQNFGNSPVADLAIGIRSPMSGFTLRGELELAYRSSFSHSHTATNTVNTTTTTVLGTNTDIRNWTTMLNVYGDFNTDSAFTPYLGAGAGLGFNRLGDLTYTFNGTPAATEPGTNKTTFAWSGMAGVGYKLSGSATLDLRYRYLDAGKVQSGGTVTIIANGTSSAQAPVTNHLKAHEITMGVRLDF